MSTVRTFTVRALALSGLLAALALPSPAQEAKPSSSATSKTSEEEATEEQAPFTDPDPEAAAGRLSVYDRVEVTARADDLLGIANSASSGTTGAADLAHRPLLRAGEVAETVPGLIATQHSGGGKANQYFLRGFNLDHGTDLSMSVAGVPVNMPSHGHGQGYADLNFLIPELIESVDFAKGTYDASHGDFSAAGSVDVRLVRTLDRGLFQLTGGGSSYGRALAAESFRFGGGDLLAGVEAYGYDGPWERPDDYRRYNAVVRYSRGDAGRGASLTALAYDGDWLATDQIPRRAVRSGLLDRFDLVDPGPRGDSQRYSLSGEWHRGDADSLTQLTAYGMSYALDLVSNFTYFLDDPVRGDQFEQVDDRQVAGVDLSHTRRLTLLSLPVEATAGVQVRYDDIDNGLFRTADLARFATVREDSIQQWTGGVYGETSVRWLPKLRTTVGLRIDTFDAEVKSHLAANSGSTSDSLVSPKLSAVLGPWKDTEVYLDYGYGFHSNDARGATIAVDPVSGEPATPVEPLVRAEGMEIGVRTVAFEGLQSTLSVFQLELDSELVFVGDAGLTEASRPSRRSGAEWANYWRALPWLAVDLDVSVTEARFTDDDPAGREIPGSLEHVVAAGVTVLDLHRWSGALRLRYFSGYPLIEDSSVRAGSTALLNGRLGYDFPSGVSLALDVFNLLDREDADIAYYYASRLPGEPVEGVEDVHFHPVEGRTARLTAGWRF